VTAGYVDAAPEQNLPVFAKPIMFQPALRTKKKLLKSAFTHWRLERKVPYLRPTEVTASPVGFGMRLDPDSPPAPCQRTTQIPPVP